MISPLDLSRRCTRPQGGSTLQMSRFASASSPRRRANLAEDGDDALVFLARNDWELERLEKEWPDVRFLAVRERFRAARGS